MLSSLELSPLESIFVGRKGKENTRKLILQETDEVAIFAIDGGSFPGMFKQLANRGAMESFEFQKILTRLSFDTCSVRPSMLFDSTSLLNFEATSSA